MVTNVRMDNNLFSQAVLAAAKDGLGVSSTRLLNLPAFLASAVGAKNALSKTYGLEHVDGIYDDALKWWFELEKFEIALENEFQKFGQSRFLTAKLQTGFHDWNQWT